MELVASEIPVFQTAGESLPGVVPFIQYSTLDEALAYASAIKGLHPGVGILGCGDSFGVVLDADEVRAAEEAVIGEGGGSGEIEAVSNPDQSLRSPATDAANREGMERGVADAQYFRPMKSEAEALSYASPYVKQFLKDSPHVGEFYYEGYTHGYTYAAEKTAKFKLGPYDKRQAEQWAKDLKRQGFDDIAVSKEKSPYGGMMYHVSAISRDTRKHPVPYGASKSNPAGADEAEYVAQLQQRLHGVGISREDATYIRALLKFYDANGRLPAFGDARREYGVEGGRHRNPKKAKSTAWYPPGTMMYWSDNQRINVPVEVAKWNGALDSYHAERGDGRLAQADVILRGKLANGQHRLAYHYQLTEQPRQNNPVVKPVGTFVAFDLAGRRIGTVNGKTLVDVTERAQRHADMYRVTLNIKDEVKGGYSYGTQANRTVATITPGDTNYFDAESKTWKRRNPFFTPDDSQAAADSLYEDFHGRGPTEHLEVVTEVIEPDHLCTLGSMVNLVLATVTGYEVTIGFEEDPPYLCSTPDGTQLYFQAGNQSIDLAQLEMDGDEWERNHMVLGDLVETTYRTQKSFDKFQTIDYYHANGEESGIPPQLLYDPVNRLLTVAGGKYKVLPEGIVD